MARTIHSKVLENIYLSGLYMDLHENERMANDMTKTGQFCRNDHTELELVSSTDMHVCPHCGGQWRISDGKVTEIQFEGFE